jgi:hypothetical protein
MTEELEGPNYYQGALSPGFEFSRGNMRRRPAEGPPYIVKEGHMSADEARAAMEHVFPKLKRWRA